MRRLRENGWLRHDATINSQSAIRLPRPNSTDISKMEAYTPVVPFEVLSKQLGCAAR